MTDTISIIENIIDTSKWRMGPITPEQLQGATERMDKEKEIEDLVRELLNSPIDLREFIINFQQQQEEIARLNREIGGYTGTVEALSEEIGFIQSRMKILNSKMLNG